MESIVLIGFMGAGKTTIGQSLANKLKMPHLDLDTALIEKIGRSIPDYFEKYGEAAFREQETQLLKELSKIQPSFQLVAGLLFHQKIVAY